MYYPMYFDPTYILVLIGVVICLIASAKMNSTFSRYSRVRNHSGMTGRDAAEQILHREGLYDVRIEHISGNLTDHYDPRTKTLRLSDATYNSTSVAALGVAAHECGHAVQHATGYVPLKLRSSLVPVANFGSSIAWPLIILGFFFNSSTTSSLFINLGILAFSLAVLFQIVTLPVEFDASHRALKILVIQACCMKDEVRDTRKVLTAASAYLCSRSSICNSAASAYTASDWKSKKRLINEREGDINRFPDCISMGRGGDVCRRL